MFRSRTTLTAAAAMLAVAVACSKQASSPTSPSTQPAAGTAPTAADGSTLKATAPTPTSPVNDQQLSDSPTLVATASALKYSAGGTLQYRFEVYNDANVKVIDSGLQAASTYRVTAQLALRRRHTWRARAELNGSVGPWSSSASFITPEGGYLRGNSAFDPLYNGVTVGQTVGPVTFLPNQGARLESINSYIRYALPQTLTAGEFSMEVQGLRANAAGDKTKVFSMSTNSDDFITDPYRVDIQYRGTGGFPPNSVTYRVLYGSADDLTLRYEPDTAVRLVSVFNLVPTTTYFWRFTWSTSEVRVLLREGGANDGGRTIYDRAVRVTRGIYNPQPHYAYVGAPSGRSGAESASIPGAIYRNVYIGPGPRP
jgi:hypothetical protein